MSVSFRAVDLSLKRTFATSRNVVSTTRCYYLESDGAVGEAAAVRFYGELDGVLQQTWRYLAPLLECWEDPRTLWPRVERALGYNSGIKCGIDLLFWDHFGRAEGATAGAILGVPPRDRLATSLSIGIGTPAEMQNEVRSHPGFAAYKLKVGFDGDLEATAAVREVTSVPLWVDANGGWTVSQACERLPRLRETGVVLCEQPIFSGRRRDWEEVRACAGMPVIVDEYCRRADDVAHWVGWVDGVNVKLQKAGGITPALEMIRRAREEGLKVMIGCMLESSVAIAGAAQLAPLADYLDLDSHLLVTDDPYEGIACRDGLLVPSGRPGLGVQPRTRSAGDGDAG